MIPITRLKQNLDFNKNLGDLIEVMKLASTLQFNQFRLSRQPYEEFLSSLEKIFNHLREKQARNIFFGVPVDSPSALVLLSSDEGFLGEFNVLLVNKLMEAAGRDDEIIVLGQQGANYLQDLKIKFNVFPSLSDKLEFNRIQGLRDHILELYRQKKVFRVKIVYARFINIISQQIESEVLLPLPEGFSGGQAGLGRKGEFLIEPDPGAVIEEWVKLWLSSRLYQIFWSSKLAEFSARIMHLEASIQELGRINRRLRLEYFKYLHGLSDKTIREISASRLLQTVSR